MRRFDPIAKTLFVEQRNRLKGKLKPNSLVLLFSNDIMPTNEDGEFPYYPNADLFYLSGIVEQECVLSLFLGVEEADFEVTLFIPERDEKGQIWHGEMLADKQAKAYSGIESISRKKDFPIHLDAVLNRAKQIYLLQEVSPRKRTEINNKNSRFFEQLKNQFPSKNTMPLDPIMAELRMQKQALEIEAIRKAGEITLSGYKKVCRQIAPAKGEWEIEALFAYEFLRKGSQGFAYQPIIAGGKNSCVLHYTDNAKILAEGELVLVDVGANFGYWHYDCTRTFPVSGRFSERQRSIYQAVVRLVEVGFEALEVGKTLEECQKKVFEALERELVHLKLLNLENYDSSSALAVAVRAFCPHRIYHHLGLATHDSSLPNFALCEGMVVTVEPGIYLPNEGLGIRLEQVAYVTENSVVVNLSEDLPLDDQAIENLINKRDS